MNWLLALANLIEDNSLGTKGSDLFIGVLPDVNGMKTVLTQSGGDVIETQTDGIAIERPSMQVRIVGEPEDFVTPYNRINAIHDVLVGVSNETLSGIYFLRVRPISGVLAIGQDSNLSYEFTANFEVSYG